MNVNFNDLKTFFRAVFRAKIFCFHIKQFFVSFCVLFASRKINKAEKTPSYFCDSIICSP